MLSRINNPLLPRTLPLLFAVGIAVLAASFHVARRPNVTPQGPVVTTKPHVPTLRERCHWNVVRLDDPWFPALSHPDAVRVIEAALEDWLLLKKDRYMTRIYDHPPDRSKVRLLRFQLPEANGPTVEGLGFILVDLDSDSCDEALSGTAPGHIGFRFDSFQAVDYRTVKITMCLLAYREQRPGTVIDLTGSLSIQYIVRRLNGRWTAVFQSAIS